MSDKGPPPAGENPAPPGTAVPSRPPIAEVASGTELARWYWTRAELAARLRDLGSPGSGSKEVLAGRLAAVLDGRSPEPAPSGRPTGPQLRDPVDADSVIQPGQRCSQVLRRFFQSRIGPGFHFDQAMRDFIADGAGRTLGDAVAHWHATRDQPPGPIGRQFEYNRFIRDWHAAHPGGAQAAAAAWRAHRADPRLD